MKIAIFTDNFLPKIDGVVSSVLNLSKGLTDCGHKVFIICPKYPDLKEEFSYKNIEVIRVNSIPAFFYPDFRLTGFFNYSLLKKFQKEKIDLIHFESPLTLGLEAIIFSRILKIPLIGTFHTFFGDPAYLKHVKLDYKIMEKIAWAYSRLFYNRCNLITCPSQSTLDELSRNKHSANIRVISNGIDFKIFNNKNSKKVKQKYNLKGPLLLFVGRIAHEKNIFFLLDSFKIVLEKIPSAKLLLIGDGPQMENVRDKIKNLKLENNILPLGKIDHKELVKSGIFGACDLFVSASLTENQPMTILESQANSLPCVVIDARGMKDLITNNYNGFLVKNDKKEFANAISRLLLDKKLLVKFRKNTSKEIEKHKLLNVVHEWEKTYIEIIREYSGLS